MKRFPSLAILSLTGSLAVALAGAASTAHGAEEPYLDNRSDAASLVKSLYNAIDRKEYWRAYSYFSPAPAANVEAYAKGFADTDHVELLTGEATSEGAAGSIYYSLPVAISSTMKDGSEKVFAGCYTLRMVNPGIEQDEFQPLHIESGKLSPAKGALKDALPAQCGDTPEEPAKKDGAATQEEPSGDRSEVEPADEIMDRAKAQFAAIYQDVCQKPPEAGDDSDRAPVSYTIPFNYSYDDQDEPKREARLVRFWCDSGAYNEMHVYFLADENGEVSPLHFATPELDIRYEDDDPEKTVEQLMVIGFTAQDQLVNSSYDPATYTMTSHGLWRGIGDASASGTWIFRSGTFSLVKYDVDASYDGKTDATTVVDYNTGP